MRIAIVVLFLPLMLAGCLSFSGTPAPRETVIVPATTTTSTTTVVCSNGMQPPC